MAGTSRELGRLVERTISALDAARLPLDMPGSPELNELRNRLITQLKTRILPHLLSRSLPTVVVLGGSSGAGKSTLFNTLVGAEVSPASVLRPTTRTPIIGLHPSDSIAMEGHALLEMGDPVVLDDAIPGLVIVDAPDLDSVEAANRELARRLLDASDLWVFVTTAARYGDATAWETLTDAYRRGITAAVVLNRVSAAAVRPVSQDLRWRMIEADIDDAPLLVVPDVGPHEGLLPPDAVDSVRSWLEATAKSRRGVALSERTTEITLPDIRRGLLELAEAVEHQANAVQDLADQASYMASTPLAKLTTNALNGRYGQGAPTATWLTFSSTGGALQSLAQGEKPGILARRHGDQRDASITTVFDAAVSAIHVGLHQGIVTADEAIAESWRRDVVETSRFREAGHAAVDVPGLEEAAIAGWKRDLVALVPQQVDKAWLGRTGLAGLLGAAAAGVSGAERALARVGLSRALRPAREALAGRFEEAIAGVTVAYQSALKDIPVGNGRQLRLRASEYADRL